MSYEVFISYHGGNNDDRKGSIDKAVELKTFLENNGVSCFLYKKTAINDFYKAIQIGLRECKHFILVACDLDALNASEWVRYEIDTFHAYSLNGEKPGCVISAYVFGTLTEKDLYKYSTAFVTKEITRGDDGFNRVLRMIKESGASYVNPTEESAALDSVKAITPKTTFRDISRKFLPDGLKDGETLSDSDFLLYCYRLTRRLKCMHTTAIKNDCDNFIEDLFSRIQQCATRKLYRVSGHSGTQKSFVLQLLYVYLIRNHKKHNYEPLYISCDIIRDELEQSNKSAIDYIQEMFSSVEVEEGRIPLYIFDGILSVNINDSELDYALQQLFDSRADSLLIIGMNRVFVYDSKLEKRSSLINGKFDNNLNLTTISLSDKEKSIDYIQTYDDLPVQGAEEVYAILKHFGFVAIDEHVIRLACDFHDETDTNIFDIFNAKIHESFAGREADIKHAAEYLFRFAFCSELNTTDPIALKALKIVCKEPIYLFCFIAMHYLNKLDDYSRTKDVSFFNLIYPKQITQFITARIRAVPHYEAILLDLGEHYYELQPHGQSEMSFYLGRIRSGNYRKAAADMLYKYYEETKRTIDEKIIADKYYGKTYSIEDYTQDLFLLRGLSVSLVYCDERRGSTVLTEYVRSLIDNDTANMINRGFHLEYYGDKRYNPNQNLLDYRDNAKTGERTLKLLNSTVETQLNTGNYHPAFLIELFTIASLLQVRIEANRKEMPYNLSKYVKKCVELVESAFKKYPMDDNVVSAYFKMVVNDFNEYLKQSADIYSPQCAVCGEFLRAMDVKRTGWVMQKVDDPESIVEHMYSCWFIGLIFLPDVNPLIDGYNKQRILNMLLVHDLAETRLEDIPKYEKLNYPDYDQKENEVMLGLLLKGTYGEMDTLTPFVDAWDEWYKMSTENARIAKDIDYLQAIYQFLIYNNRNPDYFDEKRREQWIKEILVIKTETGKSILQKLILDNPEFKETLDKYRHVFE